MGSLGKRQEGSRTGPGVLKTFFIVSLLMWIALVLTSYWFPSYSVWFPSLPDTGFWGSLAGGCQLVAVAMLLGVGIHASGMRTWRGTPIRFNSWQMRNLFLMLALEMAAAGALIEIST